MKGSCTRIATEFSCPLKKIKVLAYDKIRVFFSVTVHLLWIGINSSQESKGFLGCSNKWKGCNS